MLCEHHHSRECNRGRSLSPRRGTVRTRAEGHLDTYFEALRSALDERDVDPDAVEAEGRALYPLAWADFYRFLAGWAPDHWKINRRMTEGALGQL